MLLPTDLNTSQNKPPVFAHAHPLPTGMGILSAYSRHVQSMGCYVGFARWSHFVSTMRVFLKLLTRIWAVRQMHNDHDDRAVDWTEKHCLFESLR